MKTISELETEIAELRSEQLENADNSQEEREIAHLQSQITGLKKEHTAGPWIAVLPREGFHSHRIFAGSRYVACVGNSDETQEETNANAHLIAAAPDILTALETVPIHRLDETPKAFIERFKTWYRETRNPALTKAGSSK